jgi:hypothetical protein
MYAASQAAEAARLLAEEVEQVLYWIYSFFDQFILK